MMAVLVLATAVTMLLTLLPARSAFACSCAEMTLESIADRNPDAAVARIRRVDDGGSEGVGEVVEVLRGGDLPAELPLALDTGASCLPWVAVGDVAVLAFEPSRDGWRTMDCGMLDPATGLDEATVDAEAEGPTALVLSGSFPGADLVALDDRLRVLATAPAPLYVHRLLPCEDRLLALGSDGEGRALATRLGLPDLTPTDQYIATPDPEMGGEHIDATCVEDRVDVLVRTGGAVAGIELHRDVFGDAEVTALPDSASATFAGNVIAFVQPAGWGEGPMTVSTLDPATGHRRQILEHPAGGWELTASPGGRHVLVRGFADGPVLVSIDLETGSVVGESHGWWQPVQQPWVADDQILQLDENSGGVAASSPPEYRIVDLALHPRRELSGQVAQPLAAFPGGVVLGSADRLTVADAQMTPVRHLGAPWVVGAHDAVLLGAIAHDPKAAATPVDVAPAAANPGDSAPKDIDPPTRTGGRPAMLVAAFTVVVALAAAAIVRRRRAAVR